MKTTEMKRRWSVEKFFRELNLLTEQVRDVNTNPPSGCILHRKLDMTQSTLQMKLENRYTG